MRGGGANRGGQWNGRTQTGGKMTPPAFGAHRQGPGTSSVAAAHGAFKWQWKGLGILSSRSPAVVAHNRYEQVDGYVYRGSQRMGIAMVGGQVG
eukprot:2733605-Prymnesium_polylepis.1